MKYAILSLAASFFFLSGFTANDEKTKIAAAKKEFVNSCMEEAVSEDEPEQVRAVFKEFCTCAADNVFKQFDLATLEKLEAGDEDEMVRTVQPYMQPCMDELERKLQKMEEE